MGVEKRYAIGRPEEVRALNGVSLVLEPTEFVSVEGPSGCGKTTLLNLLGLLDTPSSGRIEWDGRPLAARIERERSRLRLTEVGFIFQRFYLLPTLTARENIELPLRAMRTPAESRRARSSALLEQVDLTPRADAFPHQLSGGEEQRVAIARAMANAPKLILADEPTGELDSVSARGVLKLIAEAHNRSRATVLLVTHNPEAARIADRHLTMRDGRVVADTAEHR